MLDECRKRQSNIRCKVSYFNFMIIFILYFLTLLSLPYCILSTAGVCWSLPEDGEWVINLRKIDPPSSIQGVPPGDPRTPKNPVFTPPTRAPSSTLEGTLAGG